MQLNCYNVRIENLKRVYCISSCNMRQSIFIAGRIDDSIHAQQLLNEGEHYFAVVRQHFKFLHVLHLQPM